MLLDYDELDEILLRTALFDEMQGMRIFKEQGQPMPQSIKRMIADMALMYAHIWGVEPHKMGINYGESENSPYRYYKQMRMWE